jgi:uncharacterized damage-inducible protein DinB
MLGRPEKSEAAAAFFTYIDQVPGDDALAVLRSQIAPWPALFDGISEEQSLHRYAPGKWSMREVLNHMTDTERAFAYRALWFSRGFEAPLASYDQNNGVAGAGADRVAWARHLEEFRRVRLATISLFENMPEEGWKRGGVAGGNYVTVRALCFIAAGHVTHHCRRLRERYLQG